MSRIAKTFQIIGFMFLRSGHNSYLIVLEQAEEEQLAEAKELEPSSIPNQEYQGLGPPRSSPMCLARQYIHREMSVW